MVLKTSALRSAPSPSRSRVSSVCAWAAWAFVGVIFIITISGASGTPWSVEPMILGHELSGVVDAIGPGVSGLVPGQKVIINPTDECGTCGYCRSGHQNLCPDLRYYGSAARTPHVQGIMVEYPMVQARQCVAVSDAMPLDQAACVEPLAIALHAVARAGNLLGKRVFVSGAGPVGCLIAAVARLNGAASVAISDMEAFPLSVAVRLGADAAFKAADPALADLANACEACFEASRFRGWHEHLPEERRARRYGRACRVPRRRGGGLSGQHDGHPQGSRGLRLAARLSGIPACRPPRENRGGLICRP